MPRNAQGLYTLPAGNPVTPGTIIESVWANTTMQDIGDALTGSLPRDGSAPMTGPLTLANSVPTAARHATSKAYVDSFVAFASGLPVGSVVAYAGVTVPPGYFECNGQAISRTLYASLFAAIGVTYGSGDGSTTFNVPDMRDEFIRGKSDSRAIGNKQAASFAAHTHAINDPGHAHTASQNAHSHTTVAHNHSVNDPGHSHSISGDWYGNIAGGASVNGNPGFYMAQQTANTNAAGTGISLNAAAPSTDTQQPAVTVASTTTGLTNGAAGGEETRPQNIAQIYIIKAAQDSSGPVPVTGITTSDAQMISVDNTNPVAPDLVIHSNVAFGTVKLDASGQIPLNLLPTGAQQLLGYWDASGGQTPSQASPSTDYASGDTYIISVTGTLTVYDPVTLTASPTVVAVGSLLQYVENSVTNPTGWYYVVSSTTVVASQVGFTPVGNISANNVQAALAEVDTETQAGLATKVSKSGDTMTGQLAISNVGPQLSFIETDASNKTYTLTGNTGKFFFRENGAGGTDRLTYDPAIGWDFPTPVRFNGVIPIIKRNNDAGAASYLGFKNESDQLDAYVGYGSGGKADIGLANTAGSVSLSGTAINFVSNSNPSFHIAGDQFYGNGTNTEAFGAGTWLNDGGTLNLGFTSATGFGSGFVLFGYDNNAAGSITINTASSVGYNTTSDYRLKDNPQPLTGSGEFIDALKPKTWTWKTDGAPGIGFIAHEVQEVSPNSVTGEKDAVNEDGTPKMQMMEYGSAEFIANIVAELQSLRRRVAELEAK